MIHGLKGGQTIYISSLEFAIISSLTGYVELSTTDLLIALKHIYTN